MKKVNLILSLFLVGIFFSCSDDDTVSKSSLASISNLTINFEGDPVYEGLGTENITISVAYGTNLTGVASVTVSDKATVLPKSGTEITFIDGVAQQFAVTAEDGNKKTYSVTVNVRGEVGSGTKLKSFTNEDGLYGVTKTYNFTYNSSNLVSVYTINNGSDSSTYELVYNDKNQILEKKNEANKIVVSYTYNNEGQIISAEEKEEGTLFFSYVYAYNTDGFLSKLTRKEVGQDDYIQAFEYTEGNTTKQTIVADEYTSTFDDKNNPFIGIFPKAYGRILAGNYRVISVNKNNFITKTGADADLTYEYNTDDYPVSYSYTVFGFATIKVSFEYL